LLKSLFCKKQLTGDIRTPIIFSMTTSPFSQNKEERLDNCAELSLGYSFRGKIETAAAGPVRVIQMRDLSENGLVDARSAARCEDYGFTEAHWLRQDDLVLRARGSNNEAARVAEAPERMALASPLVRIRVNSAALDPRYLQWFINLPASQAYLESASQGSAVRMVAMGRIGSLPILLPPLEEQRLIAELAGLGREEARLLRRLAELAELRCRLAIEKHLSPSNPKQQGAPHD
jgi:hypothetical protein